MVKSSTLQFVNGANKTICCNPLRTSVVYMKQVQFISVL